MSKNKKIDKESLFKSLTDPIREPRDYAGQLQAWINKINPKSKIVPLTVGDKNIVPLTVGDKNIVPLTVGDIPLTPNHDDDDGGDND